MNYPLAPKKVVTETIHGHKVVDNYRALENPDNPRVKKWVEAENKLCDQTIPKNLRRKISKTLEKQMHYRGVRIPGKRGGRYFWHERQPDEEQHVLYYKQGLNGKKQVLFDPNKLSTKDKIVTLDYWYTSKKGNYMAYGVSVGGNEISTLKIMDVSTAKNIEEVSANAAFASVAWLPNESGFFYTGGPRPGTVPKGEERMHYRVFFHQIGRNPKNDPVIFGDGRDKEEMMSLNISPDGEWLFITSTANWTGNDLFAYRVKKAKLQPLITGVDANFWPHATHKKVFVGTDYKAPNGKILAAEYDNLPKTLGKWKVVVPETKNQLTFSSYTKDKILACYMVNAANQVDILDYEGKKLGKLPLRGTGSIDHISTNKDEREFFYAYETFINPNTIYRYDPKSDKYELYDKNHGVLKPENYTVIQEWFKSKDGTKVPAFIVHKKGLKKDGSNPTILYGYGGFGSATTPVYLAGMAPWLEAGGVYAFANIRGGSEFGRDWHLGGIKKRKQKSYDDFIAAAEHLISQKYTSPEKLGLRGGSNGGLLVAAVSVQRPDLFRAVVSEVPLTDMVRFPYFLIASRWKSEYGDPQKSTDLKNILKFSPYHNVKDTKKYPAYLFTTAANDTRVHPMHAWKMAALLQSLKANRPMLVYTDLGTGHMGSLTKSRFYEDRARLLVFMAKELKLDI